MPTEHLEAPEFIKRVMDGEREFTGIKLTDTDIAGQAFTFLQLGEHLKEQDLKSNPIILNEAELEGIRAGGLWMPYLKANGASFKDSYFLGANFEHGEFARSSFFNTDLGNTNCKNCNFSTCYFKNTSVNKANVNGANFMFADLASIRDINEAIDLGLAKFGKTGVTGTEHKAIMDALRKRPDFDRLNPENFFKLKQSN